MIPCIFPLSDGVCMEMYKVLNENTVRIMKPPQFMNLKHRHPMHSVTLHKLSFVLIYSCFPLFFLIPQMSDYFRVFIFIRLATDSFKQASRICQSKENSIQFYFVHHIFFRSISRVGIHLFRT